MCWFPDWMQFLLVAIPRLLAVVVLPTAAGWFLAGAAARLCFPRR